VNELKIKTIKIFKKLTLYTKFDSYLANNSTKTRRFKLFYNDQLNCFNKLKFVFFFSFVAILFA
jgi:hypothetical protein